MHKPPALVSEDPRILAALQERLQFGDYILTQPLVLAKPDGRKPRGWQSRAGLPKGARVKIREFQGEYEICLYDGYGHTRVLSVHYRADGTPLVGGCPEVRDGVYDVEWALTLLTSLQPRPGAAGLLSRLEPVCGSDSAYWHDVLLHLVDEGTITEAQLRVALERVVIASYPREAPTLVTP